MTTNAEEMPLRPVRIVWQLPTDSEDDARCEWCGKYTGGTWVIEAAPMPERFCSPQCVANDTSTCWSPSESMPPYNWSEVPV